MSIAINCGYARVAIRDFAQRHKSTCGKLPTAGTAGSQVIDDYNQHFRHYPNLQVPHSVVKRIPQLLTSFNKKCHPAEKRKHYLQAFSRSSWVSVDEKEKNNHSVRGCHMCKTKYQSLIS